MQLCRHLTPLESILFIYLELEAYQEDHLCSNFFKIYALWEYPNRNLKEEIHLRALEKEKF